ncbi:cytochrome P450 [Schizophyllum commune H4-8]|uniref:Cytochrome P450 n=1 Tax=Schizophyllum commune (strain H4-8 / FGSC 9210) TaxID=578458 RepID=D8PKL6_SCHCM|nr:cytochrome P450 [Schizophyllum commune H4-8]KAI5897652.1 cytochrome P450 [Schizophyllum commune H4-8]
MTLIISAVIYTYFRLRYASPPLPPGPRPLPLLGNFLSMPSRLDWLTYMQWAKQYHTDVLYLNVFGQSMLVVDTYDACTELLEKRSALYSDRFLTMVELMGWDFSVALMPYARDRRRCRRLLQEYIGHQPAANAQIHSQVARSVRTFLRRMLHAKSDGLKAELHYMVGRVILETTYGIVPKPANDPYITVGDAAANSLVRATQPGAYLVNIFPALKHLPEWFPGAGFKCQAHEWRNLARALVQNPFTHVKAKIARGTAPPSLATNALSKATAAEEGDIRDTLATLYGAGLDTTVNALLFFFRTILDHPDVQARVVAELQNALAPGQLPTLDNEQRLPYTTAVVLESLRYRPIAPQGFPHLYTGAEADLYNGYTIPKGTIVMRYVWCTTYPDPDSFKPERFLTASGALDPTVRNPRDIVFGFGRRVCPGVHLAYTTLWLTVACTLRMYTISKTKRPDCSVIEPSSDIVSLGVIMYVALARREQTSS